jgi:hypothetical protein
MDSQPPMRAAPSTGAVIGLSLLLAAAIHVDWHLARPAHYGMSMEWGHHWIATAIVFGIVGCIIAQRWPASRWRLGAVVFLSAVFIAQGIEPVLEALIYDHRLGYEGEPLRWAAFWRAMAASTPAFWTAVWLCARHSKSGSAPPDDRSPVYSPTGRGASS